MSRQERLETYVTHSRVQALRAVLSEISAFYDEDAAVSWLFGMNREFDENAPISVLRDGPLEEVERVVKEAKRVASMNQQGYR